MSYDIKKTYQGTHLITLGDGYIDTTTGINLIGRNTPSFGSAINENFVYLLENFAGPESPVLTRNALNVLQGTLWYDTGTMALRVYDGTNWSTVSGRVTANTAPTSNTYTLNVGDQWWDSVNQQLNSWNGSTWVLVGPQSKTSYGKSGSYVESILDPAGTYHIVTNTYSQGNLISITNYDAAFTPLTSIPGFTTIQPGINLNTNNSGIFNGTAANASLLDNVTPAQYARRDQTNSFSNDINVVGNITIGTYGAFRFTGNNNVVIHNRAYQGNVNVYTTSALGNINALHIDGNTGLATVYADPVTNLGIATKQYVDAISNQVEANVAVETGRLDTALANFTTDYQSNIGTTITQLTTNLNTVHSLVDGNVSTLTTEVTTGFNTIGNALSFLQNEINSIDNYLPYLATIDSPEFTGMPQAPNVKAMNTYIASLQGSTYYAYLVSPSGVLNTGDYLTQVTVATPWVPYTNYSVGSVVYDNLSGNSYTVLGNINSSTFATISPTSLLYSFSGLTYESANLRVANPVNGATRVPVTVVSGEVNFVLPTIIKVNGTQINNQFSDFQLISTGLAFTGLGDNSANVATTAYIDATANLVYGQLNTRLAQEISDRITNVATAVAPLANIASPVFTGTPSAPTPAATDNSTRLATTAYVTNAILAQKFNYTVSQNPPSGGNDGDFWFQVS